MPLMPALALRRSCPGEKSAATTCGAAAGEGDARRARAGREIEDALAAPRGDRAGGRDPPEPVVAQAQDGVGAVVAAARPRRTCRSREPDPCADRRDAARARSRSGSPVESRRRPGSSPSASRRPSQPSARWRRRTAPPGRVTLRLEVDARAPRAARRCRADTRTRPGARPTRRDRRCRRPCRRARRRRGPCRCRWARRPRSARPTRCRCRSRVSMRRCVARVGVVAARRHAA